tara:strand:+ start:324 stop:491 length:168 start_codon:yes stop_codon:yes gene_type:complete
MTYFEFLPRSLYFGKGAKRKHKKETEYNCYGEELNNVDYVEQPDLLVGAEDDFIT